MCDSHRLIYSTDQGEIYEKFPLSYPCCGCDRVAFYPSVSLRIHWQVSHTRCRKGLWPTFTCFWFSHDITSSILLVVFILSSWLFSHFFLAATWDYLLFTLGLCFTSWLWDVINLTCLCGSHPASFPARFNIPIPSVLFLREAVLFSSLISLLLLWHTCIQPLLDYLYI